MKKKFSENPNEISGRIVCFCKKCRDFFSCNPRFEADIVDGQIVAIESIAICPNCKNAQVARQSIVSGMLRISPQRSRTTAKLKLG